MDYILDFERVDKRSLAEVGGKNASLGEMIKAGIRVPPGFAVTTESYVGFLRDSGIQDDIYRILSEFNQADVEALNRASEKVQGLIQGVPMPEEIHAAIQEGYDSLCRKCDVPMVPVAIRSSATAEDLPTASFAGQQDTYLWIQGVDDVTRRVRDCWASLFTPRAISYRVRNKFEHDKVFISVGIQKMVNAKAAGVLFTLNPTDGDRSKVVLEGNWGLGETVVSGSVTPDRFVIDKVIMEPSEKVISLKHIMCCYDPEKGGVSDVEVPEDMQKKCCLENGEVIELVRAAKLIEAHYGCPMDIEWAIDSDFGFPESLFIVQARPETVWSQRQGQSRIGKKTGRQLLMEQAMKRIKLQG